MTSLRRRFIEDMQIRNLAVNTQSLTSNRSPDSHNTSKSRRKFWDPTTFGPTSYMLITRLCRIELGSLHYPPCFHQILHSSTPCNRHNPTISSDLAKPGKGGNRCRKISCP